MLGMGGIELQQQLKSLGFNLPIIVMTLKGDKETAVRAMKAVQSISSKSPSMTKDSSSRSTPHWRYPWVRPVTAKAWPPPSGLPG
jgi:CheY-like chemotaxis protein